LVTYVSGQSGGPILEGQSVPEEKKKKKKKQKKKEEEEENNFTCTCCYIRNAKYTDFPVKVLLGAMQIVWVLAYVSIWA
jgi:hypothetical protein